MKGTFKIQKPEQIEATLNLTMTLADWEILEKQLSERWPGSDLSRLIHTLRIQIRQELVAEIGT